MKVVLFVIILLAGCASGDDGLVVEKPDHQSIPVPDKSAPTPEHYGPR